jgi:hypothetical protein
VTTGVGRRVAFAATVAPLLATCIGAGGTADRAWADVGPSDDRTEVVAVEPVDDPVTDSIDVTIEGGDDMILITAVAGVTVDVPGYFGEPYVRIDPDGTVWENRSSPTYEANRTRSGSDDARLGATIRRPKWVLVADGGSWGWHEHRAHWMGDERPPGKEPGDVVLRGEIPIRVDGRAVTVVVESVWQRPPSPTLTVVTLVGSMAVAGASAVSLLGRRRRRHGGLVLAIGSLLAVTVGVAELLSIPWPSPVEPSLVIGPATAAVAVALAAVLAAANRDVAAATSAASGAALLTVWAVERRDVAVRAVLDTTVPATVDRITTMFVLGSAPILGAAFLVVALRSTTGRGPGRRRERQAAATG